MLVTSTQQQQHNTGSTIGNLSTVRSEPTLNPLFIPLSKCRKTASTCPAAHLHTDLNKSGTLTLQPANHPPPQPGQLSSPLNLHLNIYRLKYFSVLLRLLSIGRSY
ncbi:hypothetical protein ACHWQZ_G014906 [Mnemiopsis leidyi]